MDKSIWKKAIREDANKKDVEPCNRYKGRVCAEEGKDISIVKRRERGGEGVY